MRVLAAIDAQRLVARRRAHEDHEFKNVANEPVNLLNLKDVILKTRHLAENKHLVRINPSTF
jgi:hypothetical protein